MAKRVVVVDEDTGVLSDVLALELGPEISNAPIPAAGAGAGQGQGLMPSSKFPELAYLVTKAPKELFDGTSAATLSLTGAAPSVSFKCRVTLSSVTGHTDVIGSVIVGTETLTFTSGVLKKTSTVLLSALPVVTTTSLDCHILIECLNSGGAEIMDETLTPIDVMWDDSKGGYANSQGIWTQNNSRVRTNDMASKIGDFIRYQSDVDDAATDHQIMFIERKKNRQAIELFRVLQF